MQNAAFQGVQRSAVYFKAASLVYLPLFIVPVGCSQLSLEEFSGWVARQCIGKVDRFGDLIAGNLSFCEINNFLLASGLSRF